MESTLKLDTADDIVTFLKILAEESVKDAHEIVNDPNQVRYEHTRELDKKTYGKLDVHEQEDEEAEETGDDEVVDTEEPEVEPDDEPVEEEVPEDDVSLEVSLDSITSSIKQLRSGKSVDDTVIKDQLRVYFDRLDETERGALLAFLKAFSGILTGVSAGDNAPDPSDPPYNISMSKGEEEVAAEEEPAEPAEEVPDDQEVAPSDDEVEPEDTAPPIKVGESQSLDEIRKRVRKLMGQSRV